jgi:hypothetical protein
MLLTLRHYGNPLPSLVITPPIEGFLQGSSIKYYELTFSHSFSNNKRVLCEKRMYFWPVWLVMVHTASDLLANLSSANFSEYPTLS